MNSNQLQDKQIERLRENESLTDNLTDPDARALLQWAEQQIRSDSDGDLVAAAVRAANNSGETGHDAVIAQAAAFLATEVTASKPTSPPATDSSAVPGSSGSDQPAPPAPSTLHVEESSGAPPNSQDAIPLAPIPSSSSGDVPASANPLAAATDTPPVHPTSKPRRSRKHSKK